MDISKKVSTFAAQLRTTTKNYNTIMKLTDKYPTCTLCDSSYVPSYEDYVEYCEMNEIEPKDSDSSDYWDYVSDMQSLEVSDFFTNLHYSKKDECEVLLTGTLGLWNGNRDIYPIRLNSLTKAIQKCNCKCDDIKVRMENGEIIVEASHHDGTNVFSIKPLSARGLIATKNWKCGKAVDTEVKDYWTKKFVGYLF